MLVAHRNGMAVLGKPYDAEVEYLESTGTQFIDSGVVCDSDVGFRIDCMVPNAPTSGTYPVVIGSQYSDYSRFISIWSDDSDVRAGTEQYYLSISFSTRFIANVNFENSQEMSIVNGSGTHISTNSIPAKIGLFCGGDENGFSTFGASRIYSVKITRGNVIVRDFIPVRFMNELGQSEGAMYDRLGVGGMNPDGSLRTDGLYRNRGTGNFIVGRDTNPISARSYVNDGLVAMWDGIENAGWGVHDAAATTWKDLAGNGWDGAVGSSVVIEQNAMKFDGVRGLQSCCTVGKGWFGKPPHVTIECLIQPLGWNYRGEDGTVAAFGSTESSTGGFTLLANEASTGKCRMQMRDAAGRKYAEFPFSVAENNLEIWGASATADGSSLSSYADGIQYRSIAMGDVVYTGAEDWNFYIGADYWGPVEFNFNGRIFSVRIYSRALTAAEIAANYAIDRARFNLP